MENKKVKKTKDDVVIKKPRKTYARKKKVKPEEPLTVSCQVQKSKLFNFFRFFKKFNVLAFVCRSY